MVVLDKETYIHEAVRQLSDAEVYMSLDSGCTQEIIGKINEKPPSLLTPEKQGMLST